jgi:hypothetical protein
LERCTSASESSSWPTPAASGFEAADIPRLLERREKYQKKYGNNGFGLTLNQAVKVDLWPTPRAEFDSGGHRGTKDTLHSAVKMWPTPSANEDAAGRPSGKMQKMLGNHPDIRSTGEGSLNPEWVTWLMGFPDGWLNLEESPESPSASRIAPTSSAHSGTQSPQAKPTRSSARSRKSSGE